MFSLPLLPRTLAACEKDLDSPSEDIRIAVARDLGKIQGDPQTDQRHRLLQRCLSDESAAVRRQALLSAADTEARALLDRVIALLGDPDLSVRQIAVLALGELARADDDQAVGRVAGLLQAGAAPIRYQALLAYAHLRPMDCAADLLRALFDDDVEVKKLAIRLVDEVLLAQSLTPVPELRQRLAECTVSDDSELALLAQLVCAELGLQTAHDRILRVVERRQRVTEPRDEQWAIELCGRLRLVDALPALRGRAFGVFGWGGDAFRFVAMGVLARLGDEDALRRLLKQLGARSYTQRVLSMQALANSARREARDALVEHQRTLPRSDDGNWAVERHEAGLALQALDAELGGADGR